MIINATKERTMDNINMMIVLSFMLCVSDSNYSVIVWFTFADVLVSLNAHV